MFEAAQRPIRRAVIRSDLLFGVFYDIIPSMQMRMLSAFSYEGNTLNSTQIKTDRHVPDAKGCDSPYAGWEWLRIPSLVMIVIGFLGLCIEHSEASAQLALLRFPPVLSCYVMIAGGIIFLVISLAANKRHWKRSLNISRLKDWRSL